MNLSRQFLGKACLALLLLVGLASSFAQPLHLTNLPTEPAKPDSSSPKTGKKSKATAVPKIETQPQAQQALSPDDPRVQAAFLEIDDMLLLKHAADPFFKSKVQLFSRFGPALLNSTIPPEYWTQTVDFAYSALTAQTQHLLKALQKMETATRLRYEQEMTLHVKNPRLYRRPTLDLEPIYALRRQLIELSAP